MEAFGQGRRETPGRAGVTEGAGGEGRAGGEGG